MPLLNILCPICTEVFKNGDDVYSTSCGHLFHFACLNDWRSRGTSCPQCRHYNPTSHKLFLSFDDPVEENSAVLEELQLKLKTSNEKITELSVQKNEDETNFMKMQEQFTTVENLNKELEQRIIELNSFEEDFMHLQGQYTESTELVHELECRVQQLSIESESKTKELNLQILENDSLRASLEHGEIAMPDGILSDKIKILEKKLQHISKEFEKEINTSTQLSIEKMKLESVVKHLNSAENNKKAEGHNRNHKNSNYNRQNRQNNANRPNDPNSKTVIIKDLPLEEVTLPLENIIIKLAAKMNLTISADDVLKVHFLKNQDENYSKTQLFVEFKSTEIKTKFISNRDLLKTDPKTNTINICQYMDDQLNSLFTYAKEKLRNCDFHYVFCKNNMVLVSKRSDRHGATILKSKTQVDNLVRVNERRAKDDVAPKNPIKNVDENFYQL